MDIKQVLRTREHGTSSHNRAPSRTSHPVSVGSKICSSCFISQSPKYCVCVRARVCVCAHACVWVCVCWGRVVGEELPGIISRKSQTSQVRIFNHPTIIVPKKMGNNSLIFSNSDCIQLFLFISRVVFFFSSHNWFNQIRIQTGSTYYIWFISLLSVF